MENERDRGDSVRRHLPQPPCPNLLLALFQILADADAVVLLVEHSIVSAVISSLQLSRGTIVLLLNQLCALSSRTSYGRQLNKSWASGG
jgi:hypothetical protein